MFKGLSGLKKVVKGGFSVVAEHSSQLAEQVVSDPSTSKGHIKETLKEKVLSIKDTGETALNSSEGTVQAKEKAQEVVHKVKHYGAFGEDYLGYSDPTKDLRKAVKQKEKAAKKARKAKKKKTGKKEDLFDPENLAKYKAELEEKRRQAELAAAAESDEEKEDNEERPAPADAEPTSPQEVRLQLDLAGDSDRDESRDPSHAATPLKSPLTPAKTPKDSENWKLFEALTSGVDNVIQKKKEELQGIKEESYYQQKKTQIEKDEEARKKSKKEKKKKKWVDLDSEGFEDHDGYVSVEPSDQDDDSDATETANDDKDQVSEPEQGDVEEEPEDPNKPRGLVEIPEDDPIDLDEEEDIFNTDFVNAVTSGDLKLAIIPDDPVYDDDEDDPFNTSYADSIAKTEKEDKRKAANRLKFEGLSSVADVLAGKADKVNKDLVEVTVKKKRRRANRINLIGEDQAEITKQEDIGTIVAKDDEKDILTTTAEGLDVPIGDLLTSTPSPLLPPSPATNEEANSKENKSSSGLLDLEEFEDLEKSGQEQLTSNVAILAGEFAKPVQEEEDDFDAAFDALAQEAVTKSKLEELEKQFGEDDVFDTSSADKILNLASLAQKVEEEEEPFETFEDKDPFDTSAYEDITGELEAELGFESIGKRGAETVITITGAESDPFLDTSKGADAFGEFKVSSTVEQGWAAFVDPSKPPKRPPPPKKPPPRPNRPPLQKQTLDPASRPSVVVKAPSTDSIKSWNCSVAESLIRKSELEALESEPVEEEEFDPFDTTNFKDPDQDKPKEEDEENIEDPFDTSAVPDYVEEELKKRKEKEKKEDLLSGLDEEGDHLQGALVPESKDLLNEDVDPFDTEFAADVLPNKGDPFDTSFVQGGPGKAELKQLEEELLAQEDFDPREGKSASKKVVAPGTAGRVRPQGGNRLENLEIKAPPQDNRDSEVVDEDPFDTSIVDKVIPLRKAKTSDISVEDDDFDPTKAFKAVEKQEIDPFDTSVATAVIPELQEKEEESKETEVGSSQSVDEDKPLSEAHIEKPIPRSLTDDDFDPRA